MKYYCMVTIEVRPEDEPGLSVDKIRDLIKRLLDEGLFNTARMTETNAASPEVDLALRCNLSVSDVMPVYHRSGAPG